MICDGTEDEHRMVVCDRCEGCAHTACLLGDERQTRPNQGPWYCKKCRAHIINNGPTDITEDLALIDFLFAGVQPKNVDDDDRVRMYAKICRAKGKELQVIVKTKHFKVSWVNIPPVPMRRQIL